MKTKTKLDKVNYITQGVFNGILATVFAVLLYFAFYCFCIGVQDSNGGGWIMMIVAMCGIVIFPWVLLGIGQIVTYIIGWKRYRQNRLKSCRVLALISSVLSILVCGIFTVATLAFYLKELYMMNGIFVVGFIALGYCIMNLVFSCVNITK